MKNVKPNGFLSKKKRKSFSYTELAIDILNGNTPTKVREIKKGKNFICLKYEIETENGNGNGNSNGNGNQNSPKSKNLRTKNVP